MSIERKRLARTLWRITLESVVVRRLGLGVWLARVSMAVSGISGNDRLGRV